MHRAVAFTLLAALLAAGPAVALAPTAPSPPDPATLLAEARAQVPPLPATPGPSEAVALAAALAVEGSAQAVVAVALAEDASDHAAAGAVAAFEGGLARADGAAQAAGDGAEATLDRTALGCWLEMRCLGWVAWYYPGSVAWARAAEHGAEAAVLASWAGLFDEYAKLPQATPTPGVLVNPPLAWAGAAARDGPEYAFASAQHTLGVADSLWSQAPEADLGPGLVGCMAVECHPVHAVVHRLAPEAVALAGHLLDLRQGLEGLAADGAQAALGEAEDPANANASRILAPWQGAAPLAEASAHDAGRTAARLGQVGLAFVGGRVGDALGDLVVVCTAVECNPAWPVVELALRCAAGPCVD